MNYTYQNFTGTNRDRSELFVVAVQSASGDTVPVNMSIILSAQKWVFDTIYKLAYPYLYSPNICKMNRMVLTDEDVQWLGGTRRNTYWETMKKEIHMNENHPKIRIVRIEMEAI
jgi:hypothetical protein